MWTDNIKTTLTNYKMFELKKNKRLKVLFAYVNKNEIVEIKKEKIVLKNHNRVSKEELADLLINSKCNKNITYNSYRIMNFNLNLEPVELENFLERELWGEDSNKSDDEQSDDEQSDDEQNKKEYESFTNMYSNLVDVNLNNSVNMFQNLNMLMIILQKRKPSKNQTRKKGIEQTIKHVTCDVKNRKTKKF